MSYIQIKVQKDSKFCQTLKRAINLSRKYNTCSWVDAGNEFRINGRILENKIKLSFISKNLRNRVSELSKMGFDIVSIPIDGKQYNRYLIPANLLEKIKNYLEDL